MPAKKRFYRVDGTWTLVTLAEHARRSRAQDTFAARAGRVIVRDRSGRPRSLPPDEAAKIIARQEAGRRGAATQRQKRDKATGKFGKATNLVTQIDVARFVGRGAVGRLVSSVMDHTARHLRIAKRNGRSGVIVTSIQLADGPRRDVVMATFGPGRYGALPAGRDRILARLPLDDPRPQLVQTITLSAPSFIQSSTDQRGATMERRAPDEVIEGDISERGGWLGEDPEDAAMDDEISAVSVISEYL